MTEDNLRDFLVNNLRVSVRQSAFDKTVVVCLELYCGGMGWFPFSEDYIEVDNSE